MCECVDAKNSSMSFITFFPLEISQIVYWFVFFFYIYLQLDYDLVSCFVVYQTMCLACTLILFVPIVDRIKWARFLRFVNLHVFKEKWPMEKKKEKKFFVVAKFCSVKKAGNWRWWITTAHVLLHVHEISHFFWWWFIYLFPGKKFKNKTERKRIKQDWKCYRTSRWNGFCFVFTFLYCSRSVFDCLDCTTGSMKQICKSKAKQ